MLNLSRLAPRSTLFRVWQTRDKLARLDCTGLVATVIETTLPFVPVLATVNAAQGEFRIERPTVADLELCLPETAYKLDISLIDGLGVRVEGFSLWMQVS